MDDILYSKLPSGGKLWNYISEYRENHIQKPYDNPNIENPILKERVLIKKTKIEKNRKETLMHYIINIIDPLATLYTPKMYEQSESILKDKICEIVSKGPLYQWFGPKKSRNILYWITQNNHGSIDDIGKIVSEFLSWFLDKTFKYIPENTNNIVDSKEDNVIYITYENKKYVIKN